MRYDPKEDNVGAFKLFRNGAPDATNTTPTRERPSQVKRLTELYVRSGLSHREALALATPKEEKMSEHVIPVPGGVIDYSKAQYPYSIRMPLSAKNSVGFTEDNVAVTESAVGGPVVIPAEMSDEAAKYYTKTVPQILKSIMNPRTPDREIEIWKCREVLRRYTQFSPNDFVDENLTLEELNYNTSVVKDKSRPKGNQIVILLPNSDIPQYMPVQVEKLTQTDMFGFVHQHVKAQTLTIAELCQHAGFLGRRVTYYEWEFELGEIRLSVNHGDIVMPIAKAFDAVKKYLRENVFASDVSDASICKPEESIKTYVGSPASVGLGFSMSEHVAKTDLVAGQPVTRNDVVPVKYEKNVNEIEPIKNWNVRKWSDGL